MLAFIVGRKSGFAMLFARLIAVMVYTMVIVLIIRFHDGQYLKESSSMTTVADDSQKKNTGRPIKEISKWYPFINQTLCRDLGNQVKKINTD